MDLSKPNILNYHQCFTISSGCLLFICDSHVDFIFADSSYRLYSLS